MTRALPKGVKKRWFIVMIRPPKDSQFKRLDNRRRSKETADKIAAELRGKLQYEVYIDEVWRFS